MANIRRMMTAAAGGAGGGYAGGLFHMGRGADGRSGNNASTNHCSPVQVGTETDWTDVNSLEYAAVAIRGGVNSAGVVQGGTMWSWGGGHWGATGHGNTTNYSSPVQIGGLTTWVRLGQGHSRHSVAVKTDGTLWAFGDNGQGQLGNSAIGGQISSPVQIGSLTNWSYDAGKIATTYMATVAIKKDGTMWSWGRGLYGQQGHGTTTRTCSPIQIGSLTTWSTVSAGKQHFIALKSDGTLWSWARNIFGGLGLGDTTNRSSPVQIGSLTTWTSINCTQFGGQAVKSDGKLWTWGRANKGQLGNSTTSPNKSSPIQVGSLTDWTSVVAGSFPAVFALKSGAAWAWGDNREGRLGLGHDTAGYSGETASPVQIGSLTKWIHLSGSYATFSIQTE